MQRYLIIIFSLILATPAFANKNRRADEDGKNIFGMPSFVFQTYQFPGKKKGKTRLEVKIGLVNDIIQFVKLSENRYRAGYELTIDIVDKHNSQIDGTVVNREIFAGSFRETNSRKRLNKENLSFLLAPGEYILHLDILDLDTRKHLRRAKNLKIESYDTKTPRLSSLVFLQTNSPEGNSLEQNLVNIFADAEKDYFVRFVLSGFTHTDSIAIRYLIRDWSNKTINSWQEKVLAERESLIITRALSQHIPVTGQLALKIECEQNGKSVEMQESFIVKTLLRNKEKTLQGGDLFSTPEVFKYIMHSQQFKKFKTLDSLQRQTFLDDFWKQRDPSPETGVNELKEEFEQRFAFANNHFSVVSKQKRGWNTDRGKIYLKFGKPDMVRNQRIKIGKPPLEIWVYRRSSKSFVFRDKNGEGDFELIHQE